MATIAIAGAAVAQTPSVINACAKNDDGNMRFVAGGPCKANETLLTWNQAGPVGATGPTGPAGASAPSDGVITIDQAKALAGGITAGDDPGFPVTLSTPGSYRLSGNLSTPAGTHGILIASPGVTLDLNGFTLASEGPAGGVFPHGVTDGSTIGNPIDRPRAAIRNGHINGFSAAVNMQQSTAVVVENLRVIFPFTSGVSITVGRYSRVQRNIVVGRGAIRSACPSVVTENITSYIVAHSSDYSEGYCMEYHNRAENAPHDEPVAE
jgi:hypothetical protein